MASGVTTNVHRVGQRAEQWQSAALDPAKVGGYPTSGRGADKRVGLQPDLAAKLVPRGS